LAFNASYNKPLFMKKYFLISSSSIFCLFLGASFTADAQNRVSVTGNILPINPSSVVSNIFDEQAQRAMMKKDGLSDAVIEKLIVERRALTASGRKVSWSGFKKQNPNPVPNAACSDMGVENGWGAWMGADGQTNSGLPCTFSPPVSNPLTPRFIITSGNGSDPCTPGVPGDPIIPSVAPGFGNASIQLGEQQVSGCMAEQLTYQLDVTAQDTILLYTYALVFYDPGSSHAPNEKPFADFVILDQVGDTVPCSFRHFIAATAAPGWYSANATCTGGNFVTYKPWTTVGVNLTNYVGQQLTVVITNADCSQCGHFAHSYWDFACGLLQPKCCAGQQLTLCSPDSTLGNTYQWYHNNNLYPGGTNPCINPTFQAGDTFSLAVTQSAGCNFTVQYVPLDTCLLGVEESLTENQVGIYPNPASKILSFDFKGRNFGKAHVSVHNEMGEKVYQASVSASGKQQLDVSGYAEGIYFVKIETSSGSVTRKIVISR
jgi:hypothetical protein